MEEVMAGAVRGEERIDLPDLLSPDLRTRPSTLPPLTDLILLQVLGLDSCVGDVVLGEGVGLGVPMKA